MVRPWASNPVMGVRFTSLAPVGLPRLLASRHLARLPWSDPSRGITGHLEEAFCGRVGKVPSVVAIHVQTSSILVDRSKRRRHPVVVTVCNSVRFGSTPNDVSNALDRADPGCRLLNDVLRFDSWRARHLAARADPGASPRRTMQRFDSSPRGSSLR